MTSILRRAMAIGMAAVLAVACGGGDATREVVTAPAPAKPAPEINVSALRGMRIIKADTVPVSAAEEKETAPTATPADVLLIDDFNDGEKPNCIGGNYGGWNRDPLDETQGCAEEFSLENHGVGNGVSVKLTYDVDSPNPAFNGFWMKLNEIDLSSYKELVFHVKGDRTLGFTTRIKVELKNSIVGERGAVLIDGITEDWTRFRVPLKQFFTINDWTKMSEFVIVFDDEMATKKSGAIYIDDIYFRK